MLLRTKFLALFGALAVAPLVALSVFDYLRSDAAIKRLLAAQTAAVAERLAHQIGDRYSVMRGDLELLADNEETRRLLTGRGSPQAALGYLTSAVGVVGTPYALIVFRDSARHEVLRFAGTHIDSSPAFEVERLLQTTPTRDVTLPIRDENGRAIGSVTASVKLDALVPRGTLDERVGLSGYSLVVDRHSRRVVFDPLFPSGSERASGAWKGAGGPVDSGGTEALTYTEQDTTRVAAIAALGGDGLAILSAASLAEFSSPLARVRGTSLLLALLATAALAIAFLVITGRLTRPLESLTAAADQIGLGNFDPPLPESGGDEIGRLAQAFRRMSTHVREMMRQVESGRQMAAVGSFAAQIAHEIRNPLTSIKLNLQSVERHLRTTDLREPAHRPLEICMEEIQRLDGVVRGVLQLARADSRPAEAVSFRVAIDAAMELVAAQLEAQGITVDRDDDAGEDAVIATDDELRGVMINLLLNAAEAMPGGGRIRITTSANGDRVRPVIRVAVSDSGTGVPHAQRAMIFEPFVTTKPKGSGLGLAVASRDIERRGGRLSLVEGRGELGGATFVIELPVVAARQPA